MPRDLPSSAPVDPLRQSAQYVKGVGPARFEKLQRLGVETIGDVLFYFPRAYEDLSDVRAIAGLSAGKLQTVQGEVVEIDGRHLADGRTVVSVVLSDGGTCLEGIWFNQPYAARRFRYGQRLAFSGRARWYRDHWQMANPRVQILDSPAPPGAAVGGAAAGAGLPKVLPIYPLTEDLRPEQLRRIVQHIVEAFASEVRENLPADLRRRHNLPEVQQALHDIHFPPTLASARAARRRFVYEEFLVLQLALALRRRELRDRQRAPVLRLTPTMDARIRRLFPFRLTADQDRAVAEICRDLANDRPMQRLLQADVGAGKTAVAVYALLVAVANKHQAALMAPTEVLAQQHWRTLSRYLDKSRVRRLLLTGALTSRQRRAALADIRAGQIDLVVGTQALVQNDVEFARLGLVVIDEQHKFGVHQRARIRRLGVDPHYLVMTATPIPRTVALTVFGDLDVSVIRQLPPGRQPVTTRWVPADQRDAVYQRVREGLRQGRQAYVVCPLVAPPAGESSSPDHVTGPPQGRAAVPPQEVAEWHGEESIPPQGVKDAERTYAALQKGPFCDFHVGLLHGRMDERRKDQIMEQFRRRELDLLVSTTLVEVGVDVPNATLLIVEHAERFGLSQLHQLRGRISRGTLAGHCYLFAEPSTDEARERLRVVTRTTDGFVLAEQDARLRGLGELFGTRQHGLGDLRVGDLLADSDVLRLARRDAIAMVAGDAGLRQPEHAALRRLVLERYGRTLELAEVG